MARGDTWKLKASGSLLPATTDSLHARGKVIGTGVGEDVVE